ncbi:MAG: hypothetical protein DCC52_07920 [Chloroflexi bacterium]|nr:MAG: hypothetical protein DCC52_07920 [Chloroflexota bacterium]
MSETVFQLESSILELSREEQLWLVERIIHALRESEARERALWEADLVAMAGDPAIQKEIREIEQEYSVTENDGLENL